MISSFIFHVWSFMSPIFVVSIASLLSLFERSGTKFKCCILRNPGGESIMDVVPGGTELELQVKTGSCEGCTHARNNAHVKCNGVY